MGAPRDCDVIIRNGCVVTMASDRKVHAAGAIAIQGTQIAAVGPESEVVAKWRTVRVIDADGAIVHPGFVDAHLHVNAQTCRGYFRGDASKGATKGASYADWKASLTPDDEMTATALACVEMLRHGITCFVEPGSAFDPDAVAAAAQAVGVRCTLADPYLWDDTETMAIIPGLLSPSLAKRVPPDRDRCLKMLGGQLHRNREKEGIVHGHIALYGEGTASDELLREAKRLARGADVVFNSHIGYDIDLAEQMEKRWRKPRFEYLGELGVLDSKTTFVHMNLIRDAEVDPILRSGTNSVWCPFAYASRGTVLRNPTRLPEMKRKGATVALGTDSARQSSAGDAGFLALVMSAEVGVGLMAEEILEMQTLGGARAAGLDGLIGSIEVGKRADIVVRSSRYAENAPGIDPAHQLIAVAHGGTADTVLVNGRVVMRDGRATQVDDRVVVADARRSAREVAARLDIRPSGPWA